MDDRRECNSYKYTICACLYQTYTTEQYFTLTDVRLSIFLKFLLAVVESPFGNVDSAFDYFKELLLRHCVKVCMPHIL